VRRYGNQKSAAGLEAVGNRRDSCDILVDMLDDVERGDEIILVSLHAFE